ncbi:hypothetical protein [Ralstonia phage RSF1]|uniref:DUF3307 domain-containing protein n=1 Tax=Ralstonia phage RSF1 TaxID=1689679 RepID=A0A0K2QQY8_9CAUD|nr:membrane protein [Ralstonia phage RSF1]BAS04997.1 hypothetical protein [Ralstonia phage RSF1]
MFETFILAVVALLAVHLYFDFPGQGQFLSDIKNKQVEVFPWWFGLSAHCLIQAAGTFGVVWLFYPGLALRLALAEFILHWTIDCLRVQKRISAMGDQLLHTFCKLAYAFVIASVPVLGVIWFQPIGL